MEANNTQVVQYDMEDTFGISGAKGMKVQGRADVGDARVPKRIPGYIFRREVLSDLMAFIKVGQHPDEALLLTGPMGCSKSSVITQTFSELNIPVSQATAFPEMELSDLVGHFNVVEGETVFSHGPLATAMREGHPFIFEEMNRVTPGVLTALNTITEGGVLTIPENGGEVIRAAPGFMFLATDNTAGSGDRSGLYQDAMAQNGSSLDRFIVVDIGYPEKAIESQMLASTAPALDSSLREGMIDVANEIRALFKGDESNHAGDAQVELPMSTRSLCRWARLTEAFGQGRGLNRSPIFHALDRAWGNRVEPETLQAVYGLITRVLATHLSDSESP